MTDTKPDTIKLLLRELIKDKGECDVQKAIALINDAKDYIKTNTQNGQWTVLHYAAGRGHVECVNELIAVGAEIDAGGLSGFTPLMRAAQKGQAEAVKALASAGAELNRRDDLGCTALYWAAFCGQLDCVRELIACGAGIMEVNKEGKTPVIAAAREGQEEVVKLLNAALELAEKEQQLQRYMAETDFRTGLKNNVPAQKPLKIGKKGMFY